MGISDSMPGVYKSRIDKSTGAITTGGTGAAATVITSDRGYINMPYEVYATELGKFYNIFGPILPITMSDWSDGASALKKLGHHTVDMFLRVGEKITVVRNYADTDAYAFDTYRTTRPTNNIKASLTSLTSLDSKDRISAIDKYVTDENTFSNGFVIARPYPTTNDSAADKAEVAVQIQEFGFGCPWMYEYDTPVDTVAGIIAPETGTFSFSGTIPGGVISELSTRRDKRLKVYTVSGETLTLLAPAKYDAYWSKSNVRIEISDVTGHAVDTGMEYRVYYDRAMTFSSPLSSSISTSTTITYTTPYFTGGLIHRMSDANIRRNFPIASKVVKLFVYKLPDVYSWDDVETSTTYDISKLTLLETYQGSLSNFTDIGTTSIYLEDVINGVSPYIYIKGDFNGVDTSAITYKGVCDQFDIDGKAFKSSTLFKKLYSGETTTIDSAYNNSLMSNEPSMWDKLSEVTTVDASLLISYNPASATAVIDAANKRKDAAGIVQVGNIFETADNTINNAPTGFVDPAITFAYARYGKVFVANTGKASYLPMSIIAGYLHSRIETIYDIKELPAGYDYGESPILELDVDVTTSDMIKYGEANINTVIKKPKAGYVMWNAKTMLKRVSPLNRTAPVRVLLSIMKDIGDSLDSQVFRINSAENRAKIERMGNNYLSTLITLGRITNGQVFCDDVNNGEEVRKLKKMYVDMGVTFPGYSEYIYFTAIVGDDGVTLSDLRIQR